MSVPGISRSDNGQSALDPDVAGPQQKHDRAMHLPTIISLALNLIKPAAS